MTFKIICKYCNNESEGWRHPAGHIINFCDCEGHKEATKMEICKDCGLWFNVQNKHPHKIYRPNKKLFMKWGYIAH